MSDSPDLVAIRSDLAVIRASSCAAQAVLDALADAAEALVDEGALARDVRTANAGNLAAIAGAVRHLDDAVTAARVESAGAISAAQASVNELRENASILRRMIYVGSGVLVAMTVTLLYAVLTLRGVDADAALAAGSRAAAQLMPGSTTTTIITPPASTTITTTPPAEVHDGQ